MKRECTYRLLGILLIGTTLLCVSCNNKENSINPIDYDVDTIDIDVFTDRPTDISPFIDTLISIPLEATEESLIGSIDKIIAWDSMIYIMDNHYSKAVFVFDMEGNFIDKIFRVGKGPGEYADIFDMDVDDQFLYILDSGRKIIKFERNTGEFLEEHLFDHWKGGEFITANNGSIVFYDKGFKNTEYFANAVPLCQIYETNFHGTNMNCVSNHDKRLASVYTHAVLTFSRNGNDLFVLPAYTYDYFSVQDSGLDQLYHLNFGRYNMNIDRISEMARSTSKEILNDYLYTSPVVGLLSIFSFTRDYLAIVYGFNGRQYNMLIDRKNKRLVMEGVNVLSSYEFQIGIPMPVATHGDFFYSFIEPVTYFSNEDDERFDLKNLNVDTTKMTRSGENNPILLKYRLRSENDELHSQYTAMKEYMKNMEKEKE